MTDYAGELRLCDDLAVKAGAIITANFDRAYEFATKADGTRVTSADTLINRLVIDEIGAAFPDDGVIGEEQSTASYGGGRRWLCDPLDGTLGYTWGMPTAMFSLALVVDGTPVVGVACDPFLKRLYRGVAGDVSRCNDDALRVSAETLATGTVAVTSSVYRIFHQDPYIGSLVSRNVALASFSGAVYKACLVARGSLVGYAESAVNPHDMAAVQLIVEGAGGRVTGLDGGALDYREPFKGAVVSNGLVHDALLEHVLRPGDAGLDRPSSID